MQHSPGGLPARRLYPALVAAEIEPLERHAVAIGRVEEVEIAVAGDRGDGEILGDVPIGAQRGLPELVVLERTEIRVPVGGARVVRQAERRVGKECVRSGSTCGAAVDVETTNNMYIFKNTINIK